MIEGQLRELVRGDLAADVVQAPDLARLAAGPGGRLVDPSLTLVRPPVGVEYELTEAGHDLNAAIRAVSDWARKWIETGSVPVPS